MSYQSDIYGSLTSCLPLMVLATGGVFWDVADGSTAPPYLIIQTISGNSETSFDGDRSLCFDLIQITAWAKPKSAVVEIAAILRRDIEARTLPGTSQATLIYTGGQSTYDPETKLSGEIIEYRVSAFTN